MPSTGRAELRARILQAVEEIHEEDKTRQEAPPFRVMSPGHDV